MSEFLNDKLDFITVDDIRKRLGGLSKARWSALCREGKGPKIADIAGVQVVLREDYVTWLRERRDDPDAAQAAEFRRWRAKKAARTALEGGRHVSQRRKRSAS